MGPILNGLIKLQGVENRLRAEKAKLTRCRRNVIIQENLIRSLQSAYEAKKEEMLLSKVQSDRLELDLKTFDQTISKLRASLNSARTNKEYAALLTQLNTIKADNSKVEAQVLELLKDIETDEQECKSIQQQIEQQKQALEQIRKDNEAMALKYQEQIEAIQVEWDKLSSEIPPAPLEIFKRVADTYDGEAVVTIEQEGDGIAYSCNGCYMGIPAESVNMLMTKDEVIRCPNCTRVLVLSKEMDNN